MDYDKDSGRGTWTLTPKNNNFGLFGRRKEKYTDMGDDPHEALGAAAITALMETRFHFSQLPEQLARSKDCASVKARHIAG